MNLEREKCDHTFVKEVGAYGLKTGDWVCSKCNLTVDNEEMHIMNLTKEKILNHPNFPNDIQWKDWMLRPDVSIREIVKHMEKELNIKI